MAHGKGQLRIPFVCTFYNQKGCHKPNCTFLHMCKGYLDSTCDGCTLSHDIKGDQPLSVLSACKFDTSKSAEELLEFYKMQICKTKDKQEKKLLPPLICSYYNESKCERPDCTFVHICEKYVYDCCDVENCQLSHNIKEGQAWKLLSLYGVDAEKTSNEIRKDYMMNLVQIKKKQRGKTASGDAKEDRKQNTRGDESIQKSRTGIANSKHQDNQDKTEADSSKANANVLYPYLICKRYNEKECSSPRCRYLHICGKFILDECEQNCPNDLNHRLFYVNNKPVLSGAGYNTDQNEDELMKEYKMKSQKQFSKWKKDHQPQEDSEYSRGKGDRLTGLDSHGKQSTKFQFLVCRNFNLKECRYENCKWLHICSDFIVGKCEKGQSCQKNHDLFFANNKNVLSTAGFNIQKSESELFIDYRLRLKDFESRGKSETNKPNDDKDKERHKGHIEQASVHSRGKETQEPGKKNEKQNREQQQNKGNINKGKDLKTDTGISKTIIQDDETDICRNNIRHRCKYGEKCYRHHCNLPYHWQFKVPTQPWKSFPVVVNETLEMNYCNKDIDNPIVAVASDQCMMDFKQMKGKMKDGDISLRRLSTCSFCEAPPGEPLVTQWRWYWKEENGTLRQFEYDILYTLRISQSGSAVSDLCREIEEKYIDNPENTITLKIGAYQYQIDFKNMTQTNTMSGKQRVIKRRPEYKSKSDVEKEAREKRKIPKKIDQKQLNPQQQSGSICLPPNWSDMGDDDDEMKRIVISASEQEYMDVFKMFVSSLGKPGVVVSSIERVQNPYLWQNYAWTRQKMEKHNKDTGVNEVQLFHGTSGENVDPICRTNFDWRLYGTSVGSIYGQGSYFAADAKYSDSGYSQYDKDGFKWMFVVRVLAGRCTKGSSGLRRPPPLDPSTPKGKLYDSTVDNPSTPRIYCIFDNSQYYPEYLIKYQ